MKKYFFYLLLFSHLINLRCSSQINKEKEDSNFELHNLKPSFAGQFYPADKAELEEDLKTYFANAEPRAINNSLQGIIVPHAGYVFSGTTAASAYNQINPEELYENIFLITSSHHEYFKGASIYLAGNLESPLGEIIVNIELAKKLIANNAIFSYIPEAHLSEHSAEVQLPFIQYRIRKGFKIIPIVIGTQSKEDCLKIAEALQPWFNDKNLFIVSSDFSHYPGYEDALKLDKDMADAIITNDVQKFLDEVYTTEDRTIDGLVTRACGWTSILTLMNLTRNQPEFCYKKISYSNSGESDYGDKNRVVGYNAIVLSAEKKGSNENGFSFTKEDKKDLLELARTTIDQYIKKKSVMDLNPDKYSKKLNSNFGAFVTLKKNYDLRGCIGKFNADEPLYKVVQQMAIASATKDSRFLPVKYDEIGEIEIEISVLSPLKKINSISEIILGKHGIYIVKGNHTGTFLPQVASETAWTLEQFLGHCSRDKAGIGWEGWKEAEIYIYGACVFSELELK